MTEKTFEKDTVYELHWMDGSEEFSKLSEVLSFIKSNSLDTRYLGICKVTRYDPKKLLGVT